MAAHPPAAPAAQDTTRTAVRVVSRRGRGAVPAPVLTVLALTVGLLALAPIGYLVQRAVSEGVGSVAEEVWRARTARLVVRSLGVCLAVTAACVVVGGSMAWLVERTALPGRGLLRILLALPLAVPSYLSAFAWVDWRPSIAGFGGAVLVLTGVSYPFVYLPVMAALRRLDPAQDEVARALGRSWWRVAVGLTARQVRPALTAGGLLVALYVLSDFGAVAAMRYPVFTWEIYGAYRAGFDPSRAAILGLCLVVVAAPMVVGEQIWRGRAAPSRLGGGSARQVVPHRLGLAVIPALAAVGAVLGVALAFPVWRVLVWTVSYQSTAVTWAQVFAALGRTGALAATAALITVALAFPVSILAARHRSRLSLLAERSTYVAHALPGIVVAISLVFVGVRLLRPWYLRTPLMMIGYAVLYLPLAVATVRGAVEQSPAIYEEVSAALGRRRWSTLWRITLPLAAPGVLAAAALVTLSVMKELPVTLILRPTGTETLATRLWSFTTVSDYGNAGPYALAIILFAALPTAVLSVSGLADRRQVIQ